MSILFIVDGAYHLVKASSLLVSEVVSILVLNIEVGTQEALGVQHRTKGCYQAFVD